MTQLMNFLLLLFKLKVEKKSPLCYADIENNVQFEKLN